MAGRGKDLSLSCVHQRDVIARYGGRYRAEGYDTAAWDQKLDETLRYRIRYHGRGSQGESLDITVLNTM